MALDYVTSSEMVVRPYDGLLLERLELTIAMGQSRIRRWFWALSSWEFFDLPPLSMSFESIVLDDPSYVTSSFDAYVDTNKDYVT